MTVALPRGQRLRLNVASLRLQTAAVCGEAALIVALDPLLELRDASRRRHPAPHRWRPLTTTAALLDAPGKKTGKKQQKKTNTTKTSRRLLSAAPSSPSFIRLPDAGVGPVAFRSSQFSAAAGDDSTVFRGTAARHSHFTFVFV